MDRQREESRRERQEDMERETETEWQNGHGQDFAVYGVEGRKGVLCSNVG